MFSSSVNYLHSLLDKTATEAIAGLPLTYANYQEAIDILKGRFGNSQLIINSHMEVKPYSTSSLSVVPQQV